MESLYFILILIIIIFIIIFLSPLHNKKENMMEYVEPPAGVIISIPDMQLEYCSLNHGLKDEDIPLNARCYPYKCINKRGKKTLRNQTCWIDEVYYNGKIDKGGYKLNNDKKYICDNKYNNNYDCTCKPDWKITNNNKKSVKSISNKTEQNDYNTICIDPNTYRYYKTNDYPCDIHYIQAIELEPDMDNYGDKICLINNDYEIRRKKKCDPLEISLLKINKNN